MALPDPLWNRATARDAVLRALAVAVPLAFLWGASPWFLIGLLAGPLLLIQRWRETRAPGLGAWAWAGALAWCATLLGVIAACFQAVAWDGLQAPGGAAGALQAVGAAWEALGDSSRAQPSADRPFPWWPLWAWTDSPSCLLDTAQLLASLALFQLLLSGKAPGGAASRGKCALIAVATPLLPVLCAPAGEIPVERRFTSAQGLEESAAFWGIGMIWFLLLFLSDLALGGPRRASPDQALACARCGEERSSRPGECRTCGLAEPPRRGGCLAASLLVLGCVLAVQGVLGVLPGRLVEQPLQRLRRTIAGGPLALRVAALRELPTLGSVAEGALPEVLQALREPDPDLRAGAAEALGQLSFSRASQDPAVIPALVAALEDPDPGVRRQAAWSLGVHPLSGPAAVPGLLRRLAEDPQPEVKKHAVFALETIAPHDPQVQAAWRAALSDPSVAGWARHALRRVEVR